ncbi:MAG: ATP-binding protein [Rhizobiaceae bacterium]|nr:ATP-binding protein [Rhizobiaceae bacterium]
MKLVEQTKAHFDPGDILDSLPGAVIIVSEESIIEYVNSTAENIFRSSATYMLGKPLASLLPYGSPIPELVVRTLSTNTPVNEYRIDISTPRTGEGKIVDAHVAPMAQHSTKALISFRERSMAERINRQLTHRGAARSVTGLAAMLAHEIKNPLSGIRGAAQLLETVVPAQDKELAQLIRDETDRIVKIVDRMEIFSDQTPIEREPVNMHSVLGRVRQIAENGFGQDVEFSESYDPSLPFVSGSTDQLIQVFLNLAKNASEAVAGQRKRHVRFTSAYRPGIRFVRPGSQERAALPLEFCVTDTGPGIPEELQAHIFEPFVTSRINGSGLGLALVAKVIGQHGGIVECDSHKKGTTFRIMLPAWQDNEGVKPGGKHG